MSNHKRVEEGEEVTHPPTSQGLSTLLWSGTQGYSLPYSYSSLLLL